ncbi:thiamine phosphate synthase [Lacrimispora sp. NSJ-141]|uniref:Thiamine phosphate synthase n=1 Tax=Lientehia hominis TaxID=2897778 RepID=A0AAP2RJ07_9FIRM|nr:thiamine phosphate synthase [Lientehia hominis]MCD2492636.1 thiamine phosphate synthase [Lientehia hominis]
MKFIAVTDRSLCRGSLMAQLERILNLPDEAALPKPDMVILREKDLSEAEYEALARQVILLCREYQTECILHTYPHAAERLGHWKIHLSLPSLEKMQDSGEWYEIKSLFDMTGVSVHSVSEAERAVRLGADYLTAGHVFSTDCKKGVPPRGLFFLADVVKAANRRCPVYGIGGMDRTKLSAVTETGAEGICIMSGYMKA